MFDYFRASTPRCAVCGSIKNVQEFKGTHYCQGHLNQRLEHDAEDRVDVPDGYEHTRQLNSIGLDT